MVEYTSRKLSSTEIETLEKIKITCEEIISRTSLKSANAYYGEHVANSVVFGLEKEIYVKEVVNIKTVEVEVDVLLDKATEINVAASWFQQWKIDCAPRWFRGIFPVKFKKRTVYHQFNEKCKTTVDISTNARALFPELEIFGEETAIIYRTGNITQV